MLTMLLLVMNAEARKPKAPPPPPVGWGKEEGWTGDCYFPKDWSTMVEVDRRMARSAVLNELKTQWSGARDDGVSIDPGVVESLENVLMAKPQSIETVAATNLEQCRAFRLAGNSEAALAAWEGWLRSLPGQLTKGDCTKPLTYTMFNYLDINIGWQQPVVMCKDNRARITATVADKYRTADSAPWHTAAGDTAAPRTNDPQYPCTGNELCFPGTLLGRFVTDEGVEIVFPIGTEATFRAPENGQLYLSINDYSWYDNRYFKSASIEDRVAVTIEPAP